MYCTKDCNCSLCRELRGYKPGKGVKKPAPRPPTSSIFGRLNENFILRRRGSSSIKTFQPQSLKCSEMCQQRDMGHIYDFCQRQTQTPSPTPVTQAPPSPPLSSHSKAIKDHKPQTPPKPNHKVVIYFGDSLAYRAKSGGTDEAMTPAPTTPDPLQLNTADLIPQIQNEITSMNGDDDDAELPPYIESVQNGVINIKIEGNYQQATALVDKVSKPSQALVGKPKDREDMTVGDEDDDDDDDDDDNNGEEDDIHRVNIEDVGVGDWSFVQGWRAR